MTEPTLYIIMRKDIPDMNPGKGMAQAAHAQAEFDAWVAKLEEQPNQYPELLGALDAWREDRTFGRTLVLSCSAEDIPELTFTSGAVVDPTYPWRNYYGDVYTSCETTCWWWFVAPAISVNNPTDFLKSLPLHM